MIITGVTSRNAVGGENGTLRGWPFELPPVAQLLRDGLTFTAPVTLLVGENGSGKSTIIEAIAEAYGVDRRGGGTHRS